MDAAIMLGRNRASGSVIGASTVKNPVLLAWEILQFETHNTLSGTGADSFAVSRNLILKPQEYFLVPKRIEQLKRAKTSGKVLLDHSDDSGKFGTVGAVALDKWGNLAAATSTGGLTNKQFGRVGDSPVIGAGTLADNRTCAISATGKGEEFIKHTIASEIHYRMLYNKASLREAVRYAVHGVLKQNTGGIIAVDKNGNIALEFNTKSMFRGYIDQSGNQYTKIGKDQLTH